ncbi:MAG: hypothetical protein ABSB10_06060 [Candidatus Bathyarchaeia archaeon]
MKPEIRNLLIIEIFIFFETSLFYSCILEGDFLVKKKGEEYKCEECGLVVMVENPCGCEACELVCCEQPMKPVKATAKSTASKAPAKASEKAPEKPKK